jgi:hypothetical protein
VPPQFRVHRGAYSSLTRASCSRLIDFVEAKLAEHGVEKLVPEDKILEEHARRLLEQRFADEAIKPLRAKIAKRARKVELPSDLLDSVAGKLNEKPYLPWDVALAYVLNGDPKDDAADKPAADKPDEKPPSPWAAAVAAVLRGPPDIAINGNDDGEDEEGGPDDES